MAGKRNVRLHPGLTRLALSASLCAAITTGCARPVNPLVLATTTSVGNSGLLDAVLPTYEARVVRPLLVGSGRALEMLTSAQADVVISHAPAREASVLQAHPGLWYRKILFNDFLIVGPETDPAGVTGTTDAVAAMKRIAESDARFLSRGDESGTHERERELWTLAAATPSDGRLVIAGAGMGQTLRIASGTNAYTLTDRGTFEALRDSLRLRILSSGDPRLLNTYAVLAAESNRDGRDFAQWLAEGDGRTALKNALDGGGIKGFSIWPEGSPSAHPGDLPGAPR
jgi:tungstate transport system substrate-binding protein